MNVIIRPYKFVCPIHGNTLVFQSNQSRGRLGFQGFSIRRSFLNIFDHFSRKNESLNNKKNHNITQNVIILFTYP